MRIAVIGIRGLPNLQGGVEMHCENIYTRLDNSTELYIYRRKSYLNENSNKAYSNIKFIDLPSTRIKGFETVFHTFLCCLHLLFNRVDIVHVHNIGPGMFSPLIKLMGMKVVLTFHSPNYEHKKWGKIARLILKSSEYLSLNFANQVIFVNKFQLAKYKSKVQQKSIFIPNGIEKKEPSTNFNFLNDIGAIPVEYILAVGRLTPEKGFEYLIDAINKTDKIPQLIIAGASDHDSKYLNKLKNLDVNNKVIFTGFTFGDNLSQLYTNARMFVLSSINEGFPLVMLEAMSYNLPMIVSDIPATHLIELNSEYYATAGDSISLMNRLEQLYPTAKNIKYDLSAYNWDAVAKQTIEVYKKTLSK